MRLGETARVGDKIKFRPKSVEGKKVSQLAKSRGLSSVHSVYLKSQSYGT